MRALFTITAIFAIGCSSQAPMSSPDAEGNPFYSPLPEAAAVALRVGSRFELFSIDPMAGKPESEADGFHGFSILGSTRVIQADQTLLSKALIAGVEENNNSVAACFAPRHGIRVHHKDEVYDFLICFECLQIYWYTDGEKQPTMLVSRSPLDIFNTVLTDSSVELPDPA